MLRKTVGVVLLSATAVYPALAQTTRQSIDTATPSWPHLGSSPEERTREALSKSATLRGLIRRKAEELLRQRAAPRRCDRLA